MTHEEIIEAVRPWGGLKEHEAELRALFAEFGPCLSILEIGTYKGATSAALALALPDAKVTTVDLPDPQKSWNNPQSSHLCGEAIRALGLQDKIEQLRMDSALLFEMVHAGRRFDGVFVDGDHARAAVYRDLASAAALVGSSGVIVAHDYTEAADFPNQRNRPPWTAEVQLAVDMFLGTAPEFKKHRLAGWLVSLRKGGA